MPVLGGGRIGGMKFSIRDLLWITVIAALLLCLSLEWLAAMREAQSAAKRQAELSIQVSELEGELKASRQDLKAIKERHTDLMQMLMKSQSAKRP